MDDAAIKGVIYFVAFAAILVCCKLIIGLFKSESEVARRARWVIGIGSAITLGLALLSSMSLADTLVIGGIVAAIVWVVKGIKSTPK